MHDDHQIERRTGARRYLRTPTPPDRQPDVDAPRAGEPTGEEAAGGPPNQQRVRLTHPPSNPEKPSRG